MTWISCLSCEPSINSLQVFSATFQFHMFIWKSLESDLIFKLSSRIPLFAQ